MTPSTIDEIHVIVDNASSGGNWFSPFLSSLVTVVSGVVVYIIGQYLFTIWVQPLQGYKEIRKRIAYCLTYYFEDYSNVRVFNQCTEETEIACLEGANEIRKLASELAGFSETISFSSLIGKFPSDVFPPRRTFHAVFPSFLKNRRPPQNA